MFLQLVCSLHLVSRGIQLITEPAKGNIQGPILRFAQLILSLDYDIMYRTSNDKC